MKDPPRRASRTRIRRDIHNRVGLPEVRMVRGYQVWEQMSILSLGSHTFRYTTPQLCILQLGLVTSSLGGLADRAEHAGFLAITTVSNASPVKSPEGHIPPNPTNPRVIARYGLPGRNQRGRERNSTY